MHTIYKLKNDGTPIFLNLKIGFGQKGSTRLMFGTEQYGDEIPDSFENLELGTDKTLVKKSLCINTVVHDINPSTNNTSVQVTLKGGTNKLEIPPIIQAISNGSVAYFTITINFY